MNFLRKWLRRIGLLKDPYKTERWPDGLEVFACQFGDHGPLRAWVWPDGSRIGLCFCPMAMELRKHVDCAQRRVKCETCPGTPAWKAKLEEIDSRPPYRGCCEEGTCEARTEREHLKGGHR